MNDAMRFLDLLDIERGLNRYLRLGGYVKMLSIFHDMSADLILEGDGKFTLYISKGKKVWTAKDLGLDDVDGHLRRFVYKAEYRERQMAQATDYGL